MSVFLPFRRAGIEEKIAQVILFPAAILFSLLVVSPLVIMFALSLGDPYEWWQGKRWPDLSDWVKPDRMYTRYLVRRWDYWPGLKGFNAFYGTRVTDADTIMKFDGRVRLDGNWRARAGDALACLKGSMPWTHIEPLYDSWEYFKDTIPYSGYTGLAAEEWKRFLSLRYGNARAMNLKFQTDYPTFGHVRLPSSPAVGQRSPFPEDDAWLVEYREFLQKGLKPEWRLVRLETLAYRAFLQALPEVQKGIDRLNLALGTSATSWDDVEMSETVPAAPAERRVWEAFVRERLSAYYLQIPVDEKSLAAFHKHLEARHGGAATLAALYPPGSPPPALTPTVFGSMQSATAYADWDSFARTLPVDVIRVRGPLAIWRDYLAAAYETVEKLNAAHGTAHASFASVPWPQPEIDRLDWSEHRFAFVLEEVFKNYRRAWSFITDITPSLLNTTRFALLFTVLSVMVNTGAGYVLSRYAKGTYQGLIVFFLAMAAFPIEAIAVPNFVLLRSMGLLNTVWALVLPMAVNGYYIYLMKTLFDSIPVDYFEEASINGAGHWVLFWKVALPFAYPMMAVVAVYSFLWSYSNFMWPLIVAQKSTEITLPVYLFDLSGRDVAPSLLGALMVIATVPPLAVFIFANRTLQRSLTLPRV